MKDIMNRDILLGDLVAAAGVFGDFNNSKLDVCRVINFSEKMVRLECNGRKFSKLPNKLSIIIENKNDARLT